MIGSHIVISFILGVSFWIQRRVWIDNLIGLANTIVIGSSMLFIMMNRLWGWRIGVPIENILCTDLLFMAYGACANMTVSQRFWSMSIPFFLGWFGMMLVPAYTVDLYFCTIMIGTLWAAIVFLRDDPLGRIGQKR